MEKRSSSTAHSVLFAAIAVCGSLLIGYALMEAGYRAYLYVLYVANQNFAVTTVNVRPFGEIAARPGSVYSYYQPNKPITFSSFGPSNELLQRHTTPINNYGWTSEHDYSRRPAEGEFRIAIVGDSLTASINNAKPWPDVTQRYLNADKELAALLGAKQIRVLNLGVAGASMQFMAAPLSVIARRFSAHMLIVNFIAADLGRRHGDIFSRANPTYDVPADPPVADDEPPPVTEPDLVLDGVGINLLDCEPRNLTNPACRVSPYFSLAPGVQLDGDGVERVKRELGAHIFWARVFLSTKPLLLLAVLGRPAVRVPPQARFWAWFRRPRQKPYSVLGMQDSVPPPEQLRKDLDIGVGAMKFIKTLHKNLMVTHNPLYWYLIGQTRESEADEFANALKPEGIEITRMVKYLPPGKGQTDWFTWYNLPHDGHWSDIGAEIYGEAMYRAIRERLFVTAGKSPRELQ